MISVNSLNKNVKTYLNPNPRLTLTDIEIHKNAFTTEVQESRINILDNQIEQNLIGN